MSGPSIDISQALRTTLLAGAASLALAAIKIATGVAGNSYALIADGIESLTDVIASFAVILGLALSVRNPDEDHPYGHGRLETFAGLFVAMCLIGAATLIAWQSIREIRVPHHVPEWFTLPVLVFVIIIKALTSRAVRISADQHGSGAMEADAWHHASDALTSAAAFIGISIALAGGEDWASADDWAALCACGIIYWNGLRLMRQGLNEMMDATAGPEITALLREIANDDPGVEQVEKIRVRKSGMGYLMDIHIEVDRNLTVEHGHDIATQVKESLMRSPYRVTDVTVHVEPFMGSAEREVERS